MGMEFRLKINVYASAYTDSVFAIAAGDPANSLLTLHLYLHHITQQLPDMSVSVCGCVCVCGRGISNRFCTYSMSCGFSIPQIAISCSF